MQTFARLGAGDVETTIANVVVTGMTARDEATIRHHLDEIKDLGVKMPASFPFFFRVSASFSSRKRSISRYSAPTAPARSSGSSSRSTVGSGSLRARTIPIARSKRIPSAFRSRCARTRSADWPIAEVSAHWDRLIARSWTTRGGKRERYQEGPLALMLHPDDLIHSATLWRADGSVLGPSRFAGRSTQKTPLHMPTFSRWSWRTLFQPEPSLVGMHASLRDALLTIVSPRVLTMPRTRSAFVPEELEQ
jgi:hypothetical protein